MSYEIIYKAGNIQQDNIFFPVVVMGSNNCTEFKNNRERREKNATEFKFLSNEQKPYYERANSFKNVQEIKQYLNTDLETDFKSGSIQGKYKTITALLNALIKNVVPSTELSYTESKIKSSYYAAINETEKTKIEQLAKENTKNKFLTTEQQINETLKFVEILKQNNISEESIKKFMQYHNNNAYFNRFNPDEFIRKATKKKEYKEIDPEQEYKRLIEHAKKGINPHLLKGNTGNIIKDIETMHEEMIKLYSEKRVIVLTDKGFIYYGKGRKHNKEFIIMKPKSKRFYYNCFNWTEITHINILK